MPSARLLATLIFTLLTICAILNYTARASVNFQYIHTPHVIGGRWQLVYSSLGLESLPSTIAAPLPTATPQVANRVDFRRHKRSLPVPLHFAHDAIRSPRVSLKELVVSFRRFAQDEVKADAARAESKKGRNRSGRLTRHRNLASLH